jgi:hypothetical protein
MPHVDRRAVLGEQALDDLDRPVDTGTEGAGRGQQHPATHSVCSWRPARWSAISDGRTGKAGTA